MFFVDMQAEQSSIFTSEFGQRTNVSINLRQGRRIFCEIHELRGALAPMKPHTTELGARIMI